MQTTLTAAIKGFIPFDSLYSHRFLTLLKFVRMRHCKRNNIYKLHYSLWPSEAAMISEVLPSLSKISGLTFASSKIDILAVQPN